MRTPIPILRYRDATRAIKWLGQAFGFFPALVIPNPIGGVTHARLTRGQTLLMLASLDRPGVFEDQFASPIECGYVTQSLYIPVPDPDAIYKTAQNAGAQIIEPIADLEGLGRQFTCADLESHVWIFGDQNPWDTLDPFPPKN